MTLLLSLLLSCLAASTLALPPGVAQPTGQTDPSGSATETASTPATTQVTLNGDSTCNSFMCITALVKDSNVEYTMTRATTNEVGWMSIGFGTAMTFSPLVVMWQNDDGQVTLSQRMATDYTEPEVDTSPPRIASLLAESSSASDGSSFSFSVPADGTTDLDLLWAISPTRPSSAAVDATIAQHLGMGLAKLDLTKTLTITTNITNDDSNNDSNSSNDGSPSPVPVPTSSTSSFPLTSYHKMFIAHGILLTVGFLFILPLGSLIARYVRTFSDSWFKVHQALQFYIAGPVIVAGFALGVAGVSESGARHLSSAHKNWGVAIFVLYCCQVGLGLFIHHVKLSVKRPPQNYFHAVLGLTIIAFAFYQVRTGFKDAWTKISPNGPLPNSVNIVWYTWVVVVPLLYFAGLVFLPKQYRAERQRRRRMTQPKRLETGYVTGY